MKAARRYTLLVATFSIALGIASAGWSGEGHSDQPSGARAGLEPMSSFYTGDGQLGTFTGNLVCLRCDLAPAPGGGGARTCEKSGHRHALSMDGGEMIHPLLAGSAEMQERINEGAMHGRHVRVNGKYYPSTGLILVTSVETVEPG